MTEVRARRNLAAAGIVAVFWIFLGYVSAQEVESRPVPLVVAFQSLALVGGQDVMLLQLPAAEVWLPVHVEDSRGLIDALAASHDLEVCDVGSSLVIAPAGSVCPVVEVEVLEVAAVVEELTPVAILPEALGLRLRVVQIDERRATELGINWQGGVFETASALVVAGKLIAGGIFPPGSFDRVVSFLESEGVALRLEDIALGTIVGEPVAFNRGGTINVTLARETSIERSYQYGLGLTVTPAAAGEAGFVLAYRFDDSAPSVQSVEMVNLAATTSSGSVLAGCGETVVLAASTSYRDEGEGSGLPSAAQIPGLGYLAGAGSDRITLGSFVVSLEPVCA